jgi:pyruvate/2-oxoglutarate/acetoin dehydrogenase E1 component
VRSGVPTRGKLGATILSQIESRGWQSLDAAPTLVGGDETPIPYSGALENAWIPSAERIVDDLRRLLAE